MNYAMKTSFFYKGEDFQKDIVVTMMWYSVLKAAVGGNDLESFGPAPQF